MPRHLLALDTTTDTCSVALVHEGGRTATMSLFKPRAHAERLVLLMADALRHAGLSAADLDAVAVSLGPGSYTGLRIGVSTAKGLAAATGAALIGIPTLGALAHTVQPFALPGQVVCAALPARRHEVYAGLFRIEEAGTLTTVQDAAPFTLDDLMPLLDGVLSDAGGWLAGPGAARIADRYTGPNALRRLAPEALPPISSAVAELALQRLASGDTDDINTLEPLYLKAFTAKKSQSIFDRLSF